MGAKLPWGRVHAAVALVGAADVTLSVDGASGSTARRGMCVCVCVCVGCVCVCACAGGVTCECVNVRTYL